MFTCIERKKFPRRDEVSYDEAKKLVFLELKKFGCFLEEEIQVDLNSVGRCLTREIRSKLNVPKTRVSSVDGFAVVFDEDFDEKIYITTNSVLDEKYDAVAKIENCYYVDERVVVKKKLFRNENIRESGSEIRENEVLFKKDHVLQIHDVAMLKESGNSTVFVKLRREVKKFSTRRDMSGLILADLMKSFFEVKYLGCLDEFPEFEENSFYVSTGSVSRGVDDFVHRQATKRMRIIFDECKMSPCRMTTLAYDEKKNSLLLGFPGNPASCFVGYHVLIRTQFESLNVFEGHLDTHWDFPRHVFLRCFFNGHKICLTHENQSPSSILSIKNCTCLVTMTGKKICQITIL